MKILSDNLYSTEEVAKFLKVAPVTVKRYISDKKIKSVKINGLRRFRGEDILRLANKENVSNIPIGSRTLDLFAGIGGNRLGFKSAGFQTVYANDFDDYCKVTYDLNSPDLKLTVADIKEVEASTLPDFDVLLAGFPCQAFSVAGYREGFEDRKGRGNLFFEIARILEHKKPSVVFLENVKNLRGHDKGKTFRIIEETLQNLGYHIQYAILNTMDYSWVPQNRERIYIVGFRDKKQCSKFKFPEKEPSLKSVQELLSEDVDGKYYYEGKPLYSRIKDDIKPGGVYQWRRKYVRENKKGVCPTLTANMGMGGHNVPIIKDKKGIRKLTPLECARLQGFPKNYKLPEDIVDSRLYKQLGNSVSVPVIEAIAKEIKRAISK
ncbi:MAG: DNA (cytosine-5-)-methyltransferase [Patescibacteria group bacterium]